MKFIPKWKFFKRRKMINILENTLLSLYFLTRAVSNLCLMKKKNGELRSKSENITLRGTLSNRFNILFFLLLKLIDTSSVIVAVKCK